MEFVAGECEAITGYSGEAPERGEVSWGRDVIHLEDRSAMWETAQAALTADEPFEVTYRARTRAGETRWLWERGRGLGADGDAEALEGFISVDEA
jgi:PAS domain-containing protein